MDLSSNFIGIGNVPFFPRLADQPAKAHGIQKWINTHTPTVHRCSELALHKRVGNIDDSVVLEKQHRSPSPLPIESSPELSTVHGCGRLHAADRRPDKSQPHMDSFTDCRLAKCDGGLGSSRPGKGVSH